jgi:hypothetical protein
MPKRSVTRNGEPANEFGCGYLGDVCMINEIWPIKDGTMLLVNSPFLRNSVFSSFIIAVFKLLWSIPDTIEPLFPD